MVMRTRALDPVTCVAACGVAVAAPWWLGPTGLVAIPAAIVWVTVDGRAWRVSRAHADFVQGMYDGLFITAALLLVLFAGAGNLAPAAAVALALLIWSPVQVRRLGRALLSAHAIEGARGELAKLLAYATVLIGLAIAALALRVIWAFRGSL